MNHSLTKALKSLGFSSLSSSTWWCRAGDLIHAVVISRDRHGEAVISPIVWHSSLMGKAEQFRPSSVQSPLSGNVGPSGVDSSWTWPSGTIDPQFVTSVLRSFFCRFAGLGDVRRCLEGTFVTPFFQACLSDGEARQDVDALVPTLAEYPVLGGALSRASAHSLAREFLSDVVKPLGFSPVASEDVVAVRKRGEMFDCVRMMLDLFGTFGVVTCFPWTTDVWRVDRRWKGTYYPMLRRDICQNGSPLLIDISQLNALDIQGLRGMIAERLVDVASVSDTRKFADELSSQWSALASSLRRIS